jgi:hypothetical protein
MKRAEAKSLGLFYYATGKPCKNGHVCERYVSTSACIECVKHQSVSWRRANPEAHKKAMRTWWENNKDTHNKRVKDWQARNPDKSRETNRIWAKNNPDKVRKNIAQYRAKNRDKVTTWAVTAQIKRRHRVPKWLTKEDLRDIRAFYAMSRHLTEVTKIVWEVDHIVPLQGKTVSGLHVPSNLQVVPKDVNRTKRNEFLA